MTTGSACTSREVLQPLELGRPAKRKVELGRVEHVQQDHVVPPVAKVLQARGERLDVVEQSLSTITTPRFVSRSASS